MPESYRDAKGRIRFVENDEMGERLKRLAEFLVVGGYPEGHAARYPKLAHLISRYPEPVSELAADGRLDKLPGVGEIVGNIIREFLQTGTCTKWREWKQHTPESVLEMTAIPGLGPKMVRVLYAEHGLSDLESLQAALAAGKLEGIPGLGPKTLKAIGDFKGTVV